MDVYSYRISVSKKLQNEIQSYPFLNSKNKKINLDIINYLKSDELKFNKINIKNRKSKINWIDFKKKKSQNYKEFSKYVEKYKLNNFLNNKILKKAYKNFSWKFERIEGNKNTILSLGCGDGKELIFLRLKFPQAKIYAVDWTDNVNPKILSNLNINFNKDNIYNYLNKKKNFFDLIYSSYVLEHSYSVSELFNLIYESLLKEGLIYSNLPLLSFPDTEYYNFLKKTLIDKKIKQIDGGLIDLGHPWKTNEYDLYDTLDNHKFKDIKIYGNQNQVAPNSSVNFDQFIEKIKLRFVLNRIFLNPIKLIINFLFKNQINYNVLRFYYRLSRNLSISDNNLANYVPEILFEARK